MNLINFTFIIKLANSLLWELKKINHSKVSAEKSRQREKKKARLSIFNIVQSIYLTMKFFFQKGIGKNLKTTKN